MIRSGTWGENLKWTLDEDGMLTISGAGVMSGFTWESTSAWLAYRKSIKSVEISSGVTGIGEGAFKGCSGLTSIALPEGVTSIGDYAFYGCSGLKDIYYMGSRQEWDALLNNGDFSLSGDARIHFQK